jgi:hypothetical protein
MRYDSDVRDNDLRDNDNYRQSKNPYGTEEEVHTGDPVAPALGETTPTEAGETTPTGSISTDASLSDASQTDASTPDAAHTDAAPMDASRTDAERMDVEPIEPGLGGTTATDLDATAPAMAGAGAVEPEATGSETAEPQTAGIDAAGIEAASAQAAGNGATDTVTDLKPGEAEVPVVKELWTESAIDGYRERWRQVQVRFLDDPQDAATSAEALLDDVLEGLREALAARKGDLDSWSSTERRDTEELRVTVRAYRDLLDRVLAF